MNTKKIGVVGLGPMGGAIAHKLIACGHDVSVWNRTKETALATQGAVAADSVADLIAGADAVIVSLPSYRVTRDLLEVNQCQKALRGKTLIQLSTGGPRQVRQQKDWLEQLGASFLAGSILGYPRGLGTPEMSMIFGGSQDAYRNWKNVFFQLAPNQLFIGSDPGAPAALSGPLWHFFYGAYGSYIEAAAYAETAGIDIKSFNDAATRMMGMLAESIADSSSRISRHQLSGEQATIFAILRDLESGQIALNDVGIDGLFTGAFIAYLTRAVEAGAQNLDPAATFHHVRKAEINH